jgi:hypothetical protein
MKSRFCLREIATLEMFAEDSHNPGSCLAIPQRRTLEWGSGLPEDRLSGGENAIRVDSDYLIRTMLNRRGPFCVLPQREARHTEDGGFLLHPTRVGQDNARAVVERKEIEITERIKRYYPPASLGCAGQVSQ